jgi:hypothetical protein
MIKGGGDWYALLFVFSLFFVFNFFIFLRHNTGTCFSVSSDDKLVLFLFPGIPTGDPAIVAFYDTKDKFKFGAKLIIKYWVC